jgi:hypothetical protein
MRKQEKSKRQWSFNVSRYPVARISRLLIDRDPSTAELVNEIKFDTSRLEHLSTISNRHPSKAD